MLLNTGMATHAAPWESTHLPLDATTIAQAKPANAEAHFNRARQELPEDYYVLYRVMERISRANQLHDLPWRLFISPEYDVNAFAADVNLIAFYSGLLDRVHGDPDAIACVVGHEMAHHTENHIAMGTAEREQILEQLRAEAFEEVAAEEEDLRGDLEEFGVGEWVAGGTGAILGSTVGGTEGGLIRTGINVIGGLIRDSKEDRVQEAAERINTIYAEKETQLMEEWRELSHSQEFEADEQGYVYMVRGGFDPQGCQTVMTMLSRLGVTDSETHPATPNRISAIDGFATKYSQAELVAEGESNLASSPTPLTYNLSRDRTTLRIDSRSGSRDIDELLPQ
ncbi:MAG: M48 family metalloprotease [Geitlerinemataceae cyanobacterium]